MKTIFLTVCSIIFFAFSGLINAQTLHTVVLNKATDNFAAPYVLVVAPGDSVKFKSTGGEFAIFINKAYKIFDTTVNKLNIKVNSPTPESATYKVRSSERDIEVEYIIYCITDSEWPVSFPDAPPKIIIIVN